LKSLSFSFLFSSGGKSRGLVKPLGIIDRLRRPKH
jgi:hypothetical protein